MITLITHAINLFVLILASTTDIKNREVPDWLNYGLVISAFIINIIYSLLTKSFIPIISSLIGFVFFLIISLGMFYTGQWGGGDTKLLIGIGALLGFEIKNLNYILSFFFEKQFLTDFFINLLCVGAVYGTVYSLILVFKNKRKFLNEIKKKYLPKRKLLISINLILAIYFLIAALFKFKILTLNLILVLLFLFASLFYFNLFLKSVENACMYKLITPEKLTEGDWIAREIKVNNKKIASPSDLGVSEEQIRELIRFYRQKKIGKILVKEGMPFVPSFFFAYILTLLISNNLLRLITQILVL
ncbi:MAG: A24 family peptidase [Candidatus Woesearchaeota archaeon]